MARQVTFNGNNLDVYNGDGVKYYAENGSITIPLENVTSNRTGWDLWFAIHDTAKYEFEHTENNSTDYITAPFNTTNTPTRIYANGNKVSYGSDPTSYASLSWDSGKYGGSYHLEVSPNGNNDYFWWAQGKAVITSSIGVKENTDAPAEYDVAYNLSYCTVTPQPAKMQDGTTYNLTFAVDSGYKFDADPQAKWQDNLGSYKYGTYSNGILTLTPTDVLGSIKITATAIKDAPTEYDVAYDLSHCTVTPQPAKMQDGSTYSLAFAVDSGYKFDVDPQAKWENELGIYEYGTYSNGILTLTPTDVSGSIDITATAIKDAPAADYGTARVYKVTGQAMKDVASWAYNKVEAFDISKFVYSLRRFFFDVPATDDVTIRLGKADTQVSAKAIDNDEYDIDCGTVNIDGQYKNAIDYESEIEFYLPFVGVIAVDATKVIDSAVSLVYHVNVLDGSCLASLYVNGIEIGRASGNISYEVPYTNNDSFTKDIGIISPQYLANLTPSVTISTPIMQNGSTHGTHSTVKIGDISGYTEFTNINHLTIEGTAAELEMIKSYLESGVNIA